MVKIQTGGVIENTEVEIRVSGDDEHLAELIHSDLVSRADELNQIAELGKHPDATTSQTRVDWEGWLNGDYAGVK